MRTDLLLEKLISLLNEQISLYHSLLNVLQHERRAMIAVEPLILNECTKEKENLILKIRVLEEHRINYVENLAESFCCPATELPLRKLAERVEEPFATQLLDCSCALSALVGSIHEINQSNRSLVSHSLDLVRGSLTLLNSLVCSHSVYHQTGQVHVAERSGMVFSDNV